MFSTALLASNAVPLLHFGMRVSVNRAYGPEEFKKQEIFILDGGFVKWQEKYGLDKKLTEAFAADIWQEGY